MGKLSETSIHETVIPSCHQDLRSSFEEDVQKICDYRERANEREAEAQAILLDALGWEEF